MQLEVFEQRDLDESITLIARAMDDDEGRWARVTAEFHLACRRNGLNDGRQYWVYREGGVIRGVIGLHHYVWGPSENAWLAWFAVDPTSQGQRKGTEMLSQMENEARRQGFSKLFVETYASDTFEKARHFYSKRGYSKVGQVDQYLPDGSAMIVFMKRLEPQPS